MTNDDLIFRVRKVYASCQKSSQFKGAERYAQLVINYFSRKYLGHLGYGGSLLSMRGYACIDEVRSIMRGYIDKTVSKSAF